MGPILVFGHKNPDNDSICSAVAYAHLKNLTDTENVYVPARLGPAPIETQWVFDRFGVDLPAEVAHVFTRVRDVMTEDAVSIPPDATMLDAGRLMRTHGVRALPVVEEGVVRGLINVSILAELYIDETDVRGFEALPVTVGHLASALSGTILAGDSSDLLSGGVLIGAMEPDSMIARIKPGDTLVLGDRKRTQPLALDAGVACLVVTGGFVPGAEVLERASARGAAVVSTAHDTYAAARLVNLSHPVGGLMDTAMVLVGPDMLLSEVTEDLVESPHREAVVIDECGALAGMITRTNLARGLRRRVILVDHNELSQSAPGVAEAAVLEIIDHHRVGDVQTAAPILFLNLPVGSTATIVAERYRETGVEMPHSMAGLLLAALLTDTVLLKSPTTTDTDRAVAARLATALDLDAGDFGMEMFRARSSGRVFSASEAIRADLKEYRSGDAVIAIGQIETVDAAEVLEHRSGIIGTMATLREARGYDLLMLMVTDVVREGSEIVAVGRVRLAERALGIDLESGSAWMDGILSRKKQVAARMLESTGG
ncbi:MAG: manganese-dependent inorganic [Actinobacteria bacterium]|nr:MAG: manganese-dependent inorganic [Actinomycetota bacterium]MDO8949083.1 putative manganese-dependent inorganic diphosphatase [Actinomycetota bacterium]